MDQLPFSEDDGQLYLPDFKFIETEPAQADTGSEQRNGPEQQSLDDVYFEAEMPFSNEGDLALAGISQATAINNALATENFIPQAAANRRHYPRPGVIG